MNDIDLLDELDSDCWCGRPVEECEERGGCRWSRETAQQQHIIDVQARAALDAEAELSRLRPLPARLAAAETQRDVLEQTLADLRAEVDSLRATVAQARGQGAGR